MATEVIVGDSLWRETFSGEKPTLRNEDNYTSKLNKHRINIAWRSILYSSGQLSVLGRGATLEEIWVEYGNEKPWVRPSSCGGDNETRWWWKWWLKQLWQKFDTWKWSAMSTLNRHNRGHLQGRCPNPENSQGGEPEYPHMKLPECYISSRLPVYQEVGMLLFGKYLVLRMRVFPRSKYLGIISSCNFW